VKQKKFAFFNTNKGLYPTLLIVGLSALLRYALALVNREANDPHLGVVDIILRESRLPHAGEAWESFQPKLFHWTMAQGIRLLGLNTVDAQKVFIQLMNTTAGLVVLLCIIFFLRRLSISEPVRLWSLALIAFNPAFIAIDAQATNDAFVILFASLAVLAAIEYFRTNRSIFFLWMMIATIFAGLSKGNGLVVLIALLGVWGIRMIIQGRKKGRVFVLPSIAFLFIWLFTYMLIVPYFGQYIERYQEQGSPFVTNMTADPLPSLFARSESKRPGVVSFSESYLSFPIWNLLQTPVIMSQSTVIAPAHRVSLWAQLYGGANFAHFSEWPNSWQAYWPLILDIGRCIFILALFPTMAGALWFIIFWIKKFLDFIFKGEFEEESWIHIFMLTGYLAFVGIYAWEYRDFTTMKAIFIFPALISIVFFVSRGLEACFNRLRSAAMHLLMQAGLGILVILYIMDISYLILQLAHDRRIL
jgi:Dolichyl-phosphate-mannose-protein mannosyltransferase